MTNTKNWIEGQIKDYRQMILTLGNDLNDRKLKMIWESAVNTLEATLKVIKLEQVI